MSIVILSYYIIIIFIQLQSISYRWIVIFVLITFRINLVWLWHFPVSSVVFDVSTSHHGQSLSFLFEAAGRTPRPIVIFWGFHIKLQQEPHCNFHIFCCSCGSKVKSCANCFIRREQYVTGQYIVSNQPNLQSTAYTTSTPGRNMLHPDLVNCAMGLKYHEHKLNCPLHDLETVRFTRTAGRHNSLCSHMSQECCTLLWMQKHFIQTKSSNPPTADLHYVQVPVGPIWTLKKRFHESRGSGCYKLNAITEDL